jgi:hypothetical protein
LLPAFKNAPTKVISKNHEKCAKKNTQNFHCFPAITLLEAFPFFMSNHRRSTIRQILDICSFVGWLVVPCIRQFSVELVILPGFLAYKFASHWQTRAGG